jgi:hypothetical protein
VLTSCRCDGASSVSQSATPDGVTAMLPLTALVVTFIVIFAVTLLAPWSLAEAGGIRDTNCVGTRTSFNCVTRWGSAIDPYIRLVPETMDEAEKAHFAARERKWLSRCRPIVVHDSYGVSRYRYSAPGCEFGLGED